MDFNEICEKIVRIGIKEIYVVGMDIGDVAKIDEAMPIPVKEAMFIVDRLTIRPSEPIIISHSDSFRTLANTGLNASPFSIPNLAASISIAKHCVSSIEKEDDSTYIFNMRDSKFSICRIVLRF